MKNSTWNLLLCILLCSFASSAKNNQQNESNTTYYSIPVSNQNNLQSINAFFTEDFSTGLPTGWLSIDSTGSGVKWHVTNTHVYNGTDSLSVSGTSAANGYMIYNSDSAVSNNPDSAALISKPIDCSAHPNVHLNFNEFLRHYNETATVYVSNDGVAWTPVFTSGVGLSQQDATANPHNVDIDISAVAMNQDSVYIKFCYYSPSFSFYWMIDDVKLYELASKDGALANIISPTTSCALLSATQQISVNVFNAGASTLTGGFDLSYIVDGGTAVTEHVTDSIVANANWAYTFTQTVDASTYGDHSIKVYITVAGDTNALNDTVATTIFAGSHLIDGSNSFATGFEQADDLRGFSFEDGNQDSIMLTIDGTYPHLGTRAVSIVAASADDWVFTHCFDLDSGFVYDLTYYSRTITTSSQANVIVAIGTTQNAGGMGVIIGNSRLENAVIYHQTIIPFTVPSNGEYFIGFEVSTGDSIVGFAMDDIGLTLDNGVGINENDNLEASVYPNPSTGLIHINSKLISKNGFVVEVFNPIGEVVSSQKSNQLNDLQIDLSSQNTGIYIVRIISNNGIFTRKVSVSH